MPRKMFNQYEALLSLKERHTHSHANEQPKRELGNCNLLSLHQDSLELIKHVQAWV